MNKMTVLRGVHFAIMLVIPFCLVYIVKGEDVHVCESNSILDGPNDSCAAVGQSTDLRCKVGMDGITRWQRQDLEDAKPRQLAEDRMIFIEVESHAVSFSPINDTYRWCVLTVENITESMNGRRYLCMYGGHTSCATLHIADLHHPPKNANISCTIDGDEDSRVMVVKAWVSNYSATPGISLKLTEEQNEFEPDLSPAGSPECQHEEEISQEWHISVTERTGHTLILKLQYQHQTTGDTLHELVEESCIVPESSSSSLGTGPILGIVIGVLIFLIIITFIIYYVNKKKHVFAGLASPEVDESATRSKPLPEKVPLQDKGADQEAMNVDT